MKIMYKSFIAVLISITLSTSKAIAGENSKLTNPTAVVLEVGGKTFGPNLSFDRVISKRLSVGVGIGNTAFPTDGLSLSIPVYTNLYLSDSSEGLFLTGGTSLIVGNKPTVPDLAFEGSISPNAGVGFEARGYSGFLTRVVGYALIRPKSLYPWIGVSFGYSF